MLERTSTPVERTQEDIFLWLSQVRSLPMVEGAKKFAIVPIRPVTVHQVLSAKPSEYSAEEFKLDGHSLDTVSLVALITDINDQDRYFALSIDDGSQGRFLRVFLWKREWKEANFKELQEGSVRQGTYARILGRVARSHESNIVNAEKIMPIGPDFHEIFCHQLRVIQASKFFEEGPDFRLSEEDSEEPEELSTPDATPVEPGPPPSSSEKSEPGHNEVQVDTSNEAVYGMKEPPRSSSSQIQGEDKASFSPSTFNLTSPLLDPTPEAGEVSQERTHQQSLTTNDVVPINTEAFPAGEATPTPTVNQRQTDNEVAFPPPSPKSSTFSMQHTSDPLAHLSAVERSIMLYILEQRQACCGPAPVQPGYDPSCGEASASTTRSQWKGVHLHDLARNARKQHRLITSKEIMEALDNLSDEGRIITSVDDLHVAVAIDF